jgi:hypothetical protein
MSNDQSVRLSRDELYERVWKSPMTRLATEFGISDTGLKKICRRVGVPCPPAGWWAKKAAGKSLKVTPLPPLKPGIRNVVTISRTPRLTSGGLSERIDELANSVGEIRVPERLVRPHPVIASWIAEHRQRQEHAREYRRTWPQMDYSVPDYTSVERRRQRLLHALFAALEKQGATISQDDRKHLFAELSRERIEFSCHEKSRQVMRPLTEDEKRWRLSNTSGVTKELQPTGCLEFQIRRWVDQPFRKLWLETERHPLDAMLPEIVATFLALSTVLAEQTRRYSEQARAAAERQREAEFERQCQQREDNRWDRFVEIADRSRQADTARELIAKLRHLEPTSETIEGRSVEEWLAWAEAKADELDPLSRGLGGLLAEVATVK